MKIQVAICCTCTFFLIICSKGYWWHFYDPTRIEISFLSQAHACSYVIRTLVMAPKHLLRFLLLSWPHSFQLAFLNRGFFTAGPSLNLTFFSPGPSFWLGLLFVRVSLTLDFSLAGPSFQPGLWIRIVLMRIRIQLFFSNCRSTKTEKKLTKIGYFLIENCNLVIPRPP